MTTVGPDWLAIFLHEIRTPLTVIDYSLRRLQRTDGDSRSVAEVCGTMARQLVHINGLLKGLRESGQSFGALTVLHRQCLEITDLVRAAIEAARPLVESAGHHLTLDFPNAPQQVFVDPSAMLQIFSNLLNNAAKYTPCGGTIAIRIESRDGEAVIGVRDDGIGIPAEFLPCAFDLYTRSTHAEQTGIKGSGVGLAVVKKLVEAHQGRIEIFSAGLGTGTEVRLRLPLAESARHGGDAGVMSDDPRKGRS